MRHLPPGSVVAGAKTFSDGLHASGGDAFDLHIIDSSGLNDLLTDGCLHVYLLAASDGKPC